MFKKYKVLLIILILFIPTIISLLPSMQSRGIDACFWIVGEPVKQQQCQFWEEIKTNVYIFSHFTLIIGLILSIFQFFKFLKEKLFS